MDSEWGDIGFESGLTEGGPLALDLGLEKVLPRVDVAVSYCDRLDRKEPLRKRHRATWSSITFPGELFWAGPVSRARPPSWQTRCSSERRLHFPPHWPRNP